MPISQRRVGQAAMALLLSVAACDRPPPAETPEVIEARRIAARDACIALTLLEDAEENLVTLQAFAVDDADAPLPGARGAALEFARAYYQQAQLRAAAFSRADSAANHAAAPADSLRYMQAATAFLPGPAEAGTLEGNVTTAWMRNYSSLVADEDHRCHWDI